jgi:hypothetical protein
VVWLCKIAELSQAGYYNGKKNTAPERNGQIGMQIYDSRMKSGYQ